MVTNAIQEFGDKIYNFGAGGAAKTGWAKIEGKYYYFNPEMQYSKWMKGTSDGKWHYFGNEMKFNIWMKGTSDGKWYYFDDLGVMQTGWVNIMEEGCSYEFASNGVYTGNKKVFES